MMDYCLHNPLEVAVNTQDPGFHIFTSSFSAHDTQQQSSPAIRGVATGASKRHRHRDTVLVRDPPRESLPRSSFELWGQGIDSRLAILRNETAGIPPDAISSVDFYTDLYSFPIGVRRIPSRANSRSLSFAPPVQMAKKRRSLQSIFIPSFLQGSMPPTPGGTSGATTPRSRAPSSAATSPRSTDTPPLGNPFQPDVPELSPPSTSSTTVSSPRDSPPLDFLLDDDPFANLSSGPTQFISRNATPVPLPPPEVEPTPATPRSPLMPTIEEAPKKSLARTHSAGPPSTPETRPRAFSGARMQPRPAHQKPAFAYRPSLPSLNTLAKMNVVLTKKVRKGRVGAGLPFEPWDNPDCEMPPRVLQDFNATETQSLPPGTQPLLPSQIVALASSSSPEVGPEPASRVEVVTAAVPTDETPRFRPEEVPTAESEAPTEPEAEQHFDPEHDVIDICRSGRASSEDSHESRANSDEGASEYDQSATTTDLETDTTTTSYDEFSPPPSSRVSSLDSPLSSTSLARSISSTSNSSTGSNGSAEHVELQVNQRRFKQQRDYFDFGNNNAYASTSSTPWSSSDDSDSLRSPPDYEYYPFGHSSAMSASSYLSYPLHTQKSVDLVSNWRNQFGARSGSFLSDLDLNEPLIDISTSSASQSSPDGNDDRHPAFDDDRITATRRQSSINLSLSDPNFPLAVRGGAQASPDRQDSSSAGSCPSSADTVRPEHWLGLAPLADADLLLCPAGRASETGIEGEELNNNSSRQDWVPSLNVDMHLKARTKFSQAGYDEVVDGSGWEGSGSAGGYRYPSHSSQGLGAGKGSLFVGNGAGRYGHGWGGGGHGGDDDDDGRDGRRRNNRGYPQPISATHSSSESTNTSGDESTDDYGHPSIATDAHALSSNPAQFPATSNTYSSDDDDVPLAQRIPTALVAQKSIRRQVRQERMQRRQERALRLEEQGSVDAPRERHTTLRPAGAGGPSYPPAPMSSSEEAALHAAIQLPTQPVGTRKRTLTMPSKAASPFSAEDLAMRLQSVQSSVDHYGQQQQQHSFASPTSARPGYDAHHPTSARTPSSFETPEWSPLASGHSRGRSSKEPALLSASPPSPLALKPALRPMRSFHYPDRRPYPDEHHHSAAPFLGEAEYRMGSQPRDIVQPQSRSRAPSVSVSASVSPQARKRSLSLSRNAGAAPAYEEAYAPPVPPLPTRMSVDDVPQMAQMPRKLFKASSGRTSTDAEHPSRPSIQRSPIPPPLSLPERGQIVQQRVFVGDMQRFNMVEVTPLTTAGDVLGMIEAQGSLGGSGSAGWMVWEVAQDFGMERPIRDFELLSDVQASWNKDKMVNLFVLKMTPLSVPLSRSAVPLSSPKHAGYVEWEVKRGKWSKRWMQLREHSIWLSKRDNCKDEVQLCSLSNFDAYHMNRTHRAPKPFAFAIKSTDNLSFFENAADYLHSFSCSEKDGRVWMEKILVARSYVLHQERQVLFNPKASGGNGSAALSRSGTRKMAPPRSAAPLIPVPPPYSSQAQSHHHHQVFEPGSLLHGQT